MEHLKKKKRFSWRDLLYKSLLFVGTVALIVYFLPRDGKFNYQFDINKPWKYGQLIATFDFPIYKEDAVVPVIRQIFWQSADCRRRYGHGLKKRQMQYWPVGICRISCL